MQTNYDALIIGGGPNGLITAAYLARAGLKVAVVEKRHETGGGLTTEDFAGFRYNLHAVYHLMAEVMPPYQDFNLQDLGVMYIYPEVQVAFLGKEKNILLYKDLEKTVAELSKISKTDAEKYKKMYLEFQELSEEILIPATYAPPIPPIEYLVMLNKSEIGRKLAEISELSPKEIIDSYNFETEELKTLLLFLCTVWGIEPTEGGLGFLVPLYIYRMTNVALLRGGSHRLSSALVKIIVKNKGDILDGREVSKIEVENGKATGVILNDGRKISAKLILSSVNPQQTFLNFVSKENLTNTLYQNTQKWHWEKRSFLGIHLSLKEKPIFSKENEDINNALIWVLGYDTQQNYINHLNEIAQSKIPQQIGLHITCSTLFDRSQAPTNYHTLRIESIVPSSKNINWDEEKNSYTEKCLAKVLEISPNIFPVINKYIYTPLDIERKLSDMKYGSIKQGEYNPLQMGYFRPNDECSSCATPIKGLYICGASVYPGGMIIAGSGYNAANKVCEDLNIKKWWEEPEFVKKAREKELIP